MLLLACTLIACGSDDDDNDDSPPATTGTNGGPEGEETTGSSGTSGTTGTRTSCLSSRQRENIRTFLNRLSDLRTFTGTGTDFRFDPPDSEETRNIQGTFNFSQSSENSWDVNWDYSDVDDPTFRETDSQRFALVNGCLTIDGVRARSVDTSDSNLSYRYSVNGRIVRDSTSLSSGKLRIRSTLIEDRSTLQRFFFVQD